MHDVDCFAHALLFAADYRLVADQRAQRQCQRLLLAG
jgi:hypothetical protein